VGDRFSTEVEYLKIRFLMNKTLFLLVDLSRKECSLFLNLILFFNIEFQFDSCYLIKYAFYTAYLGVGGRYDRMTEQDDLKN